MPRNWRPHSAQVGHKWPSCRSGIELPHFAAFTLLKNEAGRALLRKKFAEYADIARKRGLGIVMESSTWRANSDWGERLGYSADELAQANEEAIGLLEDLRKNMKRRRQRW